MFVQGQVYIRNTIHHVYGGQQQGGISTPSHHNFIMLFVGEQGYQYGYRDGWNDDGIFFYTGEGQAGDMSFVRGNRAVRDHIADGKDLHLFEYVQQGQTRYVGQMVCIGFHERQALDKNGNKRKVIVFELAPIDAFYNVVDNEIEMDLWNVPLSILRERALTDDAYVTREPLERKQLIYYRSQVVRTYVLRRANGRCEGCSREAPFKTSDGKPYLESHHLRRLSDGGPDHPSWVVALCPNCHKRAHYGADREEFNTRLVEIVRAKECSESD